MVLTVGPTAAIGSDVISSTATVTALNETETNPGNDSASDSTSITFSNIFDFGDAPYPTFPTLLASDSARHRQPSALFLGATVDAEQDGQPSIEADSDDNSANDEDGLVATATIELVDGGLGDDDLTVNGAIVDPGGPAIGFSAPVAIPTLTTWGLGFLCFVLAFWASMEIRRRSL